MSDETEFLPKLILPLKAEYFNAIKAGTKTTEYRRHTFYWAKRLDDREYSGIVLTLGYPKASDTERRIERPWRGFTMQTITHPHFGPDPVHVYAIDVSPQGGDTP